MDYKMNAKILSNLISEINLKNSLVIVNLISGTISVNNICVDSAYVDRNDIIFTGRRSAFIDKLSLQISNTSSFDIKFEENKMKYSLTQNDSKMDFYIHT